jgi:tRNA(His) guanylyltransferase
MTDSIGIRMKENYENRFRYSLPRRAYTIIRIDGKAFHTYTRGLERPFDVGLIEDMNITAQYLCKEIMGARFAYVQSDEISILVTDFENINSEAWFDNNVQKIVSVSASMATTAFNKARLYRKNNPLYNSDIYDMILAEFDSRVFQIPQRVEVENYFIWRQQDTVRNSIASVAQSLYSHKELNGKNSSEQQEMIFKKGINWNDYDPALKRGRIVIKESYLSEGAERTRWVIQSPPTFTEDRSYLSNLIPSIE